MYIVGKSVNLIIAIENQGNAHCISFTFSERPTVYMETDV